MMIAAYGKCSYQRSLFGKNDPLLFGAENPVLALSDALAKLETGSAQRFVCFTFDDGYRDNLTLALPIFKKYGLRSRSTSRALI